MLKFSCCKSVGRYMYGLHTSLYSPHVLWSIYWPNVWYLVLHYFTCRLEKIPSSPSCPLTSFSSPSSLLPSCFLPRLPISFPLSSLSILPHSSFPSSFFPFPLFFTHSPSPPLFSLPPYLNLLGWSSYHRGSEVLPTFIALGGRRGGGGGGRTLPPPHHHITSTGATS